MSESLDPAPPAAPRKRWLPRLRFSLRTLIIFVSLIASAGGVWWRWEPWIFVRKHGGEVSAAPVFSASGGDYFVSLKDNAGKPAVIQFDQAGRRIRSWDFAADPQLLFSGPANGHIGVWTADIEHKLWAGGGIFIIDTQKSTPRFIRSAVSYVGSPPVALLRGEKLLAYNGNSLILQDAVSEAAPQLELKNVDLKLSPGGEHMVVHQVYQGLDQHELKSVDPQRKLADLGPGDVTFSVDSRSVYVLQENGTATCWDVASNLQSWQALLPVGRYGRWLAAPNGGILVACGNDRLLFFDMKNGNPLGSYPAKGWAGSGAISCKGIIAFSDLDGIALIRPDGTKVVQLAALPNALIFHWAVWSPDGTWLLVAKADEGIAVWHRRRPEYWWGIAWLPEFWLTVLFAGAFAWSVWRDRKRMA
jgi:WD40 repeat protein